MNRDGVVRLLFLSIPDILWCWGMMIKNKHIKLHSWPVLPDDSEEGGLRLNNSLKVLDKLIRRV